MIFWHLIGALAAALTTFSFVPQIIKVWKTRSGRDLSPLTLFQLSTGVGLWIVYGLYRRDLIIISANVITLLLLVILILLYFRHRDNVRD